jgi:hypothetical protein
MVAPLMNAQQQLYTTHAVTHITSCHLVYSPTFELFSNQETIIDDLHPSSVKPQRDICKNF